MVDAAGSVCAELRKGNSALNGLKAFDPNQRRRCGFKLAKLYIEEAFSLRD
jgi:hypothetical protein